MGIPATTNPPSATKRAATRRSPRAPRRGVVTSSVARSSASARRTSSRPNGSGSANREHPVDGAPRPRRDLGCDGNVVLQVAKRVAQLFQSDLLHVTAFGRLTGGDKLLPGILAPQSMQRSEEHTSELQSRLHLVCRLLLEKKKKIQKNVYTQVSAGDR